MERRSDRTCGEPQGPNIPRMTLSMSMLRQASTIFPSSKRSIVMPEIVTRFPVGTAHASSPRRATPAQPAHDDLVAFRHLVFNAESHVREGAPVHLNRALQSCQALRRGGVVWVVVHEILGDQVIQPLDRTWYSRHRTPRVPLPCCARTWCLHYSGHRSCSGPSVVSHSRESRHTKRQPHDQLKEPLWTRSGYPLCMEKQHRSARLSSATQTSPRSRRAVGVGDVSK